MSSSPESKKTSPSPSDASAVPATNAATTPATTTPAAASASAKPATPTASTSTQTTSTNQSNVQFKTANIGQWASKQESPFAEQNRRADAKRKQAAKTRRKVLPAVIVGGVVAVGLVVLGVVMLVGSMNQTPPAEEEELVFESIMSYRDALQNIYNKASSNNGDSNNNGDGDSDNNNPENNAAAIAAVAAVVDEAIAQETNPEVVTDMRLSQLLLYINNGDQEAAVNLAQDLLDNYQVSLEGQTWCLDVLYQKAMRDENYELAKEYHNAIYQLDLQIGGLGGGA